MKRYLLVIGFMVSLNMACKKSPFCHGGEVHKGIIVSGVSISCRPDIQQENYIIRSDSAYRKLFNHSPTSLPTCSLPSIDFASFDLLGLPADGSGCDIMFIRKVKRVKKNKRYEYSVKVRTCGLCKMLGLSDNWVLVPKIPEGWEVDFEVK
jgi:hypothetical protein